MNCKQANELCMIQFLADEGHHPMRINGKYAWFYRPNGNEKEASLRVADNKFKDFGTNQKGGTLDLAMIIWNCSIEEALQKLSQYKPNPFSILMPTPPKTQNNGINILSIEPIKSKGLYAYLFHRGINPKIAKEHLKEVHFTWDGGKPQYALGFMTNSGSFELRNSIIKLCTSPKDITTVTKNHEQLFIYEGFMDFLSHLQLRGNKLNADALILNSIVNLEKAYPTIQQYKKISLFLDNDIPGKTGTNKLIRELSNYNITDCSSEYQNYKDLNDFLTSK